MNVCSKIHVLEIARVTELAGATNGSSWYLAARPLIDRAAPGCHVLDFAGIRLATVSWLREGLLALQQYATAMRPDVLLMATGLADLVREELQVALAATGSVIIVTDFASGIGFHNPTVVGHLDPALRQTLGAVRGVNEFDATYVSRALPGVGLSAANNRLSALQSKGILTSKRRGRSRVYQPVLENLEYGYRNDPESYRHVQAQAAPVS